MEKNEYERHLKIISDNGFERISQAIEIAWGSRDCENYLKKLLVSDREGRRGFPPEVFKSIIALANGHPETNIINDLWGSVPTEKIRKEKEWTSNQVVDTPRAPFPTSLLILSFLMALAYLLWKGFFSL